MICLEQRIIPELLSTSISRSEQLIELLQSYGISYACSHFNIDPSSGFRSLEHLEVALQNKKDSFSAIRLAQPISSYRDLVESREEHEQVAFYRLKFFADTSVELE